ncbi:MAG TPA: hypothetical protein VEB66_11790 [Opitutaceae bacterium]|nr:hypothetical protein [Opitutaceae bacterium]
MHTRLLSFLSDLERAIAADDPAPDGGAWDANRTVNYQLGLARLALAVRAAGGPRALRGAVLVQSFLLADGTPCLKARFSWRSTEATVTHAIYAKPDTDWVREARRLAAEWLAGPPATAPVASLPELAPAPLAASAI